MIDYIGLKAKRFEYVISFTNEWEYHNLKDLPNFAYSSAIAKFQLELKENVVSFKFLYILVLNFNDEFYNALNTL